jgi:hypothetical protein
MFSVSLIMNKGSESRTQMLFKCQQVVENIRWYYFVTKNSLAAPAGTGIPALGAATVNLPYLASDANWAFWGPQGANVMETSNGPYKISYVIQQDAAQNVPPPSPATAWVITVSAVPTDVAGAAGAPRYVGLSTKGSGKRVDYVAQYVQ